MQNKRDKIEEGCIAIVINGASGHKSVNLGKIVRVGKFVGKVIGFDDADQWEVDKPMLTSYGNLLYLQKEINLQRLDVDIETNEEKEPVLLEAGA